MLLQHLKAAREFHQHFGLQLKNCSQTEMFERNNLLLEEIGELQTEILANNQELLQSEAIDVYYIILGNFVAFGYTELPKVESEKFTMERLVFNASKLAQATRKRFDDEGYNQEFLELNLQIIGMIKSLFTTDSELNQLFTKHHLKAMNKKRKKIGDSYVISNFN